jgi:hypothetical protein
MAGAALVQNPWLTIPAETQKLACLPSAGALNFIASAPLSPGKRSPEFFN